MSKTGLIILSILLYAILFWVSFMQELGFGMNVQLIWLMLKK